MQATNLKQLWLLCYLALLACGQNQPDHRTAMLLSERGFVKQNSCLQRQFVQQEQADGKFEHLDATETCARQCWDQVNCRGFQLGRKVCKFFNFNACSENLTTPNCKITENVWLRWTPMATFSRHSPMCPIGFLGKRFGSSRFQLVSVAEYLEGWLGGMHECRLSSGLVKFADVNSDEEANDLLDFLKQHQVEAAYLSGYFGYLNGELRWLWQPCKEAINQSVLDLLDLRNNVTVIRQKHWSGRSVKYAVCECLDPFSID